MSEVTLILGGARSGKSRYSEQLAEDSSLEVKYIATAIAGDHEMAQRITEHQLRRPPHWLLIEEPLALPDIIIRHSSPDTCLLVDCLTLWLNNCLFGEHQCSWADLRQQLLEALQQAQGIVLLVSNEVGQGIVPLGVESRRFVDEAGWLHQAIAKQADRVVFITAGLPQVLK